MSFFDSAGRISDVNKQRLHINDVERIIRIREAVYVSDFEFQVFNIRLINLLL